MVLWDENILHTNLSLKVQFIKPFEEKIGKEFVVHIFVFIYIFLELNSISAFFS